MEDIGIKVKTSVGSPTEWSKPILAAKEKTPPKTSSGNLPKIDSQKAFTQALKESDLKNQKAEESLAKQIRSFLDTAQFSLQFIPNKESGHVTIKVYDSSGRVVRQIPPEEIAALAANMGSTTGILVDEKLG
jgi:uncharacterized FlaG/YvyC family protein